MRHELLEHHLWYDLAIAFFHNRGRREFRPLRRSYQVDPDTDHDKAQLLGPDRLGFEKHAGNFTAVQQQVVRPFIREALNRPHYRAQRPAHRQGGYETELPHATDPAVRPQNKRNVEIAVWRYPRTPAPPAAGCLLASPNNRAFRRATTRQMLCLFIGTSDRVVAKQSIAWRQPRLPFGHRAKSAKAAASAPPTIGPGRMKKNNVTTAVTNSTPLSSVVNGRSKAPTGSSKYMTLTTRR